MQTVHNCACAPPEPRAATRVDCMDWQLFASFSTALQILREPESVTIMASCTFLDVDNLGGYDHQFVDPPPSDLFCLICTDVAKDPYQVTCCGKIFCKGCLQQHKNHKDIANCPQCSVPLESFRDVRSAQHISALIVKCKNAQNGCNWVNELRSFDRHIATCEYNLVDCPNGCKVDNSDQIVRVTCKDKNEHLLSECPHRKYECPHCDEKGEYQERTTTHLEECLYIEVPCPNDGCNTQHLRGKLPAHRAACQHEVVKCKYALIGCTTEISRKRMRVHETESQDTHLDSAFDTVVELKEKQIKLENTLQNMHSTARETDNKVETMLVNTQNTAGKANETMKAIVIKMRRTESKMEDQMGKVVLQLQHSNDLDFTFKLSNFSRLQTCFGPPFYTHRNGYKMCTQIRVNGHTYGGDTYVSVYHHLLKGVNDDHLQWPFEGTVTIKLLNQLEDKNHFSASSKFPSDSEASARVIYELMWREKGLGYHTFISHANLNYNPTTKCQYLRDDCLYFQVSVAFKSDKPWLTCTKTCRQDGY